MDSREPVLPFDLDLRAPGAGGLAQALHQQLRVAIVDGRLAPGFVMPSTRRLAAALGVARNTVLQAVDRLVAEGYLQARRGARARVTDLARRQLPLRRAARGPLRPGWQPQPLWQSPALALSPSPEWPARSFRLGMPEHRLFPHALWRQLTARALRAGASSPFAYAPVEGLAPLRAAIAQHTAFARAVVCAPDDVLVTAGAQQAFDLLARVLVTPGRTAVAVEEPGYPPLRAAWLAAGAQLVPVPVDDEGLQVEQLSSAVRVVCVTPSHQSPTGVALSARRRRQLLDWARQHDALIVEDDYDGEFRYGQRPLDAMQTLDREGRVFYVGTFSKSLFPALRKGFIVMPPWARAALLAAKRCADAHGEVLSQQVLAAFIHDGHLARHVRRMQTVYARRRQALLQALQQGLSPWLQALPSEAGLHLCARVRDGRGARHAQAVVGTVLRLSPGAQSTADYALAPAPPALVFGYGAIDVEDIRAWAPRLRRALLAVPA